MFDKEAYLADTKKFPHHYSRNWKRFLAPGTPNLPYGVWLDPPPTCETLPEPGETYFATKFSSPVDECVYEMALEGHHDMGSVDEMGWYSFVTFSVDDILQAGFIAHWTSTTLPVAAILVEDDRGFVSVDYFDTHTAANHDWAIVVDAYNDFWENLEADSFA